MQPKKQKKNNFLYQDEIKPSSADNLKKENPQVDNMMSKKTESLV